MHQNALLNRPRPLFMEFEWRAPEEPDGMVVVDPSTGKTLAEIEGAGPRDTASAVAAADRAFPAWRRVSADERGDYLTGPGIKLISLKVSAAP